ncbi:hypothetical protein [Wenyingzhuangia sp. IMCC45574]
MLKLYKSSKESLPKGLLKVLNDTNITFNPSYVELGNKIYVTIRKYDNINQKVLAFLYIYNIKEQSIKELNLSEFLKHKIDKVSDPKIFLLNKQPWININNGHTQNKENTIAIIEVLNDNDLNYYECLYTERQKIEKNWGFFMYQNKIHSLYNINKCVVLKEYKREAHQIFFEQIYSDKTKSKHTIGTPLIQNSTTENIFIGHKKVYFLKKRLYLGKCFRLIINDNKFKILSERKLLIHSTKQLFGSKFKLNPNLISCTYFSGLFKKNDSVIIGYGVNDISWNLIRINLKKLWK